MLTNRIRLRTTATNVFISYPKKKLKIKKLFITHTIECKK